MEEEKKLFGKLFNSIDLSSEEHLDLILQNMNKDNAFYILTQAVKLAYESGVYSMGEVEVISKSIRVLTKKEPINSDNN